MCVGGGGGGGAGGGWWGSWVGEAGVNARALYRKK